MDAETHYVIHEVVVLGHRMEDVVDMPLLFLKRNLLVAEVDGGFTVILGSAEAHSDNISKHKI